MMLITLHVLAPACLPGAQQGFYKGVAESGAFLAGSAFGLLYYNNKLGKDLD